jgi:hypothetical protein
VTPTEVGHHPPAKYAQSFRRSPFWGEFANAGEGGGGIGMNAKMLSGQYALDCEYLFEYYS